MSLDELRSFLVVAELQNVSRAAAVLNISQPALSRTIGRLEQTYGVELFDRPNRRLRLNRYGRALVVRVEAALRELAQAEDDIATMRGPRTGTVELAFLHSFGTWLVPGLLGEYAHVDALTRFALHQDSADEVAARVADGRAHLAVTSPRPRDPLLDWVPLRREPLALAAWPEHPLVGRSRVELMDVLHEHFIAMPGEFGLRQTTDALFAARGVHMDVVLESAEIATIKALVRSGLGVAIVPGGLTAPSVSGVVLLPLADEDAFRTIGLSWHLDRRLPAAAGRFRGWVLSRPREGDTAPCEPLPSASEEPAEHADRS
ncbi:LysR family transcriptional regulator [Streptomyces sp. NBC_01198]|uniref:LysR family transcriptional regulator n=1 Tax=Streptomyces sp. NBC_01198 TaxID=2903769 RepID=UPI002E12FCB5|nr:LysR family transcriptional regulator [Streptomyces sp. NBC_01198]